MTVRSASHREGILAALRELIAALDRRLPRAERRGEVRIAREAAALRRDTAMRIEQLTSADRQCREAALAAAVMADDGWPQRTK
jgi:hypothetical protein